MGSWRERKKSVIVCEREKGKVCVFMRESERGVHFRDSVYFSVSVSVCCKFKNERVAWREIKCVYVCLRETE